MIFNFNDAIKHSYSNDDTCFSINVIDEILEEDFDTLLDEGSKILHSIEGTILEEEIFSEFDKFIAMAANENYDSKSDEEEPKFEKITINTDYKIKTSLEEPPTDLELKPLPDNLEYVFLEEPSFLPVIISSQLSAQNKRKFIQLLDNKKPVVQKQRRLNPNMQEVVKKEIMKLLDTDIIYPITDSPWVSFIHYVPKKGGITVVTNENDELVPTRTVTATFQRCMLAIFHDMIEESVEVFMDDFSVFGNSFDKCLNNLDKMIQRCKDAHLILNWEKCHFMVKEGIMLGHKVSGAGLEFDKAKINVILKLPPPTNIKEFDIEIKDKKGTENVAVDHLSRININKTSDDSEVDDNFPRETLMEINTRDEPWKNPIFSKYVLTGICNISPNGVFGNKVYGDDLKTIWCESYKNQSGNVYVMEMEARRDKGVFGSLDPKILTTPSFSPT
ncbi:reverse transcriptase domain-containing protein [Tanacetum coccineum]